MNADDIAKCKEAVSAAASVANFNSATHVRHTEQLVDEINRALKELGKQDLDSTFQAVWHKFKTDDGERIVYGLEFSCESTQDLPKSPSQIREACGSRGLRVTEVDYSVETQKYRVVLQITGQTATRRSRRLRDENPDFKLDEAAVPAKIARKLGDSFLDDELKEEAGIARAPASRAIKISSKSRFGHKRRSPKKTLKRRTARDSSAPSKRSWFSFSYWFGGGETSEDNEVIDVYKDDQSLFAY